MKIRPASHLKAVTMVDRGSVRRIWGQAFVAGVLPVKVTRSVRLVVTNSTVIQAIIEGARFFSNQI